MKAQWSLHRWSSQGASQHGGELVPAPLSADVLKDAFASVVLGESNELAFIIVRLDADDRAALDQAIKAANSAPIELRVCLAMNHTSLDALDVNSIDGSHVGVMLDDVDADTPLSAMTKSPVEAIRFRAEFVARASRNLRVGCVLESMLLLAHNLGLCTMGPSTSAVDESIAATPRFDYVPAPTSPLPSSSRTSPRLAFADGSVRPIAHLSR